MHVSADRVRRRRGDVRQPITRSRLGCLTCRTRKVKCDETPEECSNCRRIGLVCRWTAKRDVSDAARVELPTATLSRRQQPRNSGRYDTGSRPTACIACRRAKVRCSMDWPDCSRCQSHRISCAYHSTRSVSPTTSRLGTEHYDGDSNGYGHDVVREATPSPALAGNDRFASRQELDQLLQAFFTHIYPVQANAIVSRSDLYRDVHNSSSPLLVQAISAAAFRFLVRADNSHADGGPVPAAWAREILVGLTTTLETLSETRLATILVLFQHEMNSGRHASCWMLSAMAVRMAFALRCNVEMQEDYGSWKFKETRRRLMWASFRADMVAAGGIKEYTLIPPGTLRCCLPSDNHHFTHEIPSQGVLVNEVSHSAMHPLPLSPGTDGLLPRFMRLMVIRGQVLKNVKMLDQQSTKVWDPSSPLQDCLDQLRHWKDTLPPELELTAANLFLWQGSSEHTQLVAIHMWFDQIRCDLYRISLAGFAESAPLEYLQKAPGDWVARAQYECYSSALSVTQKFRLVEHHFPDLVLSDMSFPIFAYESMRNQLQYLRTMFPLGQADAAFMETVAGFDIMINAIGRMTRYFNCVWPVIRDLNKLLVRHGYPVNPTWADQFTIVSSAGQTPEGGPVLSRQHWLRGLWRQYAQASEAREQGEPLLSEPRKAFAAAENATSQARQRSPLRSYRDDLIHREPATSEPLSQFLSTLNGVVVEPSLGVRSENQTIDDLLAAVNPQLSFPDISPFFSIFSNWSAENAGGGQQTFNAI